MVKGLISTFVEVTGKKTGRKGGRLFCPSPAEIGLIQTNTVMETFF